MPDRKRLLLLRGTAVLCVLVFCFWMLDRRLSPALTAAAGVTVEREVTALLCNAVEAANAACGDAAYTVLVYDTQGGIAAVETNAAAMSRFQHTLLSQTTQALTSYSDTDLSVPLGAASGFRLLAGRGPGIRIRVWPVGAAGVELTSSFSDAGINQTRHQLLLTVSVRLRMTAPLCGDTVTVTYQCLLAETILVGDLPEGIWKLTD